jgi:hypothetical protein
MEKNKWFDFVIAFADKLHEHDYNGAIDMTTDEGFFDTLTESQSEWLENAITTIREKHNI